MFGIETKELARRLYVNDGWSIESVSSRIRASVPTLQQWKAKYGWDKLRKEFVEASQSFTEEAASFAAQMMKDIRVDYAEKKIDESKVKLMSILLQRIEKVILIDMERKKTESKKEITVDGLPEEVLVIPEVQDALAAIKRAVDNYNRRSQS